MKQFFQKAWAKSKKPLKLICYIYGAMMVDGFMITVFGDSAHVFFEPAWIATCFSCGIQEF
ncbi:MAG: hypothetical protein MJ240_03225 [Kiritimatiellae bacterium]|nr:hypothetical protein [Kiritimatiellia bacterium]